MGFIKQSTWMKVGICALSVGALGGCRIKSVDSYLSATTADAPSYPVDDPYSYGGVAYATGGLKPQVSYGTGARGDNDGATRYFAHMRMLAGPEPKWTVEGDPINERRGQFQTPWIGRVKDAAGSPFGTLSGY